MPLVSGGWLSWTEALPPGDAPQCTVCIEPARQANPNAVAGNLFRLWRPHGTERYIIVCV